MALIDYFSVSHPSGKTPHSVLVSFTNASLHFLDPTAQKSWLIRAVNGCILEILSPQARHLEQSEATMATAVVEEGSSLTNAVSDDATSKCASSTPSRSAGGLDLAAIAPIINAGFRAVLNEASKLGVLDPPHGRTPMPDPKKITEEEAFAWSDNGDPADREETDTEVSDEQPTTAPAGTPEPEEEEEDDDDDKLLEYKFDYGFNPLVFLGEYLRKNNPAALRAREEQRNADLEYLRGRAAKALARESALAELRELVMYRQSGITHGPIVGEVSDCGCIVWARAFRAGALLLLFVGSDRIACHAFVSGSNSEASEVMYNLCRYRQEPSETVAGSAFFCTMPKISAENLHARALWPPRCRFRAR